MFRKRYVAFLDELSKLAKKHDELTDTDVRERLPENARGMRRGFCENPSHEELAILVFNPVEENAAHRVQFS